MAHADMPERVEHVLESEHAAGKSDLVADFIETVWHARGPGSIQGAAAKPKRTGLPSMPANWLANDPFRAWHHHREPCQRPQFNADSLHTPNSPGEARS